jgi:hypothetical protein
MNNLEPSKALRQIPPRYPCPISVENGFNKQTVILRGYANMTSLPRHQMLDSDPLIITQNMLPYHDKILKLNELTEDHNLATLSIALIDDRP